MANEGIDAVCANEATEADVGGVREEVGVRGSLLPVMPVKAPGESDTGVGNGAEPLNLGDLGD